MAPINTSPRLVVLSPTAGNSRWLAPEIILPDTTGVPVESKAADIFAFGMLVAEVLTGKPSFEGYHEPEVMSSILKGDRPELPQNAGDLGLTVPMWGFIQMCWDQNPTKRPEIDEVVKTWEGFLQNYEYVQRALNDRVYF